MAVDCSIELLDEENNTIIFLVPNQVYSGSILNQNDADYYKYEMYENETMTFTLRIFPRDLRPITAELTLYRYEGGALIELGTSFLDQFYNNFTYDGTPGEYRFCIKSQYPIDYELEVEFTDYPYTLFPQLDYYHGSFMPVFDFAQPGFQCDSAVYYELIDGELPDGLYISSSGFIFGIPEELDCQTLESDLPSFTFYEESPDDGNKARISTSYDFPITVRAALVDDPATNADRDFIICVRNNWDYDRDNFTDNLGRLEVKRFTDVEVRGRDLNEEVVLTPEEKLKQSQCPPCVDDIEPPTQLSPIEIAELCAVLQINEEYAGLIEINNGECIVCEEPEEPQAQELIQIEKTEICIPCEEPTVVEGLQPLPESMCVCPIEQETVVVETTQLFEDIPDDCLPDLVARMNGEKVCDGPINCPERSPIYPAQKPQVKISLPDVCKQECE